MRLASWKNILSVVERRAAELGRAVSEAIDNPASPSPGRAPHVFRGSARASRSATMGALAGAIVHEVRQPLTAAIVNADASLRWMSAEPPNLVEARAAIVRAAEDGRRANDILDSIEAMLSHNGGVRARIDPAQLVEGVLALVRAECLAAGVSVDARFERGMPNFSGDRVQMAQVLVNIITNARESFSNYSVDKKCISVDVSAPSELILFRIRDNGPGISKKNAGRIFQPFFSTKVDGLGIGLFLCKILVEGHGGRLTVDTELGEGTTFKICLPITRLASIHPAP
jgi:signal transduction histidine kinase